MTRRDWLTLAAATAAGTAAGCSKPRKSDPLVSPFAGQPAPQRPNIIVFLADTLRADHLGCYGYDLPISPHIDELAARGVLFERNISGSTWTKPALGTALTGVPARVHQAVVSSRWQAIAFDGKYRVQALRDAFETIPQALKRVGYSTAYFQSNSHGRAEFGYGRGFDAVHQRAHYSAPAQIDDAFNWLTRIQQPFFMFVHEIDPHGPYVAHRERFRDLHGLWPEEAALRVDPAEFERVKRYVELLGMGPEVRDGVSGVSEAANKYIRMRYDAEIHQLDAEIRRFTAILDRWGVLDNTVFALTSDHGEAFDEHGFYAHGGQRPFAELVNVPLILAGGPVPQNLRVPHTTTMLDFYATILSIAGAPMPEYVPSKPMLSADGGILVNADRAAYIDLDDGGADKSAWEAALVTGRHKVASRPDGGHWIFDLEADPGEHHNLADSMDAASKQPLIDALAKEVQTYDQMAQAFGDPEWVEAGDDVEEALNALGYV